MGSGSVGVGDKGGHNATRKRDVVGLEGPKRGKDDGSASLKASPGANAGRGGDHCALGKRMLPELLSSVVPVCFLDDDNETSKERVEDDAAFGGLNF